MFPLRDKLRNGLRNLPWWVILLLGIAAILVGLALVLSPRNTAIAVMRVVGVVTMLGGAVTIVRIPWDRRVWGWKLSGGALAIIVGWGIFTQPLVSAYLVSAIIFWTAGVGVLVAGAVAVIAGIGLSQVAYVIVGALGLLFGVVLVFTAVVGAVAVPSLIGIVGFLGGLPIIGAAFQRRSQAQMRVSSMQPYVALVEPDASARYQP